jgi:hypothetical protein
VLSPFLRHLPYPYRDNKLNELNLCLDLELRVQKDNFATFMDEKQNQWTLGFDSLDVLVNLVKQFILCKTVFRLYFFYLYLYEGFWIFLLLIHMIKVFFLYS